MANVQHIVTGNGAPVADPPSQGAHYVDLDYGEQWLAVGAPDDLYWFGPLAEGRLEPVSTEPTGAPEHRGQRKIAGSLLWLGVGTSSLADWRKFPFILDTVTETSSLLYANNGSPLANSVQWTPAANTAPHVLEAPGWAATVHVNMRILLVRPDASQPLRLSGMTSVYCNLASTHNAGAVDVTLTAPVNLIHVTHAPGAPWVVQIEPVTAPT